MVRYSIQSRRDSSKQETEDVQDQQRQRAQIHETRTTQDRMNVTSPFFQKLTRWRPRNLSEHCRQGSSPATYAANIHSTYRFSIPPASHWSYRRIIETVCLQCSYICVYVYVFLMSKFHSPRIGATSKV